MPIQPHLVPLLKGAVDPRRGIIMRTYYVRPDKLAEMIERARTVPVKSYIHEIPNYAELSKAVKINDISGLRNLFPKKSKSWEYVKSRAGQHTPAQQKGRLSQTFYALALRPDTIVVQAGRKFLKDAATKFDIVVIENAKPTKDAQALRVKYTPILQRTADPVTVGLEMSRLLCLINMRPRKLTDVVLSLVTKETFREKAGLIPNLLLPIHTYMSSPVIWTEILTTWLTYWATDENYVLGNYALLHHLSVLRRINEKRFNTLVDTYEIPPSINYALNIAKAGFEAIFEARKLDIIQKAILLNTSVLDSKVPSLYAYAVAHPDLDLSLKAAVANLVPTDKGAKLFADYFANADVLEELIDMCKSGAKPTCAVLMAQLKAAKHQGWHFIPYSLAPKVEGHPLVCQAPTRFLKILPLRRFDLAAVTKKDIEVHLDLPEIDSVPFIHFQPVMCFKEEKGGLKLRNAKIMRENDGYFVVLHPILSVVKS